MIQTLAQTLGNTRNEVDKRAAVFSIGDLAREFNVTLRTLRFYEDKGLLFPSRNGLTRIYSRRDRARLKLILMGKRVGFSLNKIKEILDLYDLQDGQVTQLRVALTTFKEQIDHLQTQKSDIEWAIAELKSASEAAAIMLKQRESERS